MAGASGARQLLSRTTHPRNYLDSPHHFHLLIHQLPIYTPLEGARMSTSAPISPAVSQDEFQALEQKVLRAVEIVRHEREARAAAEAAVARLQQQISDRDAELEEQKAAHTAQLESHAAELGQHNANSQAEIAALQQERAEVRQRVEKMLGQMDELL
jgi:DNA polymerase III gamma/tau subunit